MHALRLTLPLASLALLTAGCRHHGRGSPQGRETVREVSVYTSLDRPYAEPVLRAFERRSGIRVLDVYDAEATKSVGLAARIVYERARPRADVFPARMLG